MMNPNRKKTAFRLLLLIWGLLIIYTGYLAIYFSLIGLFWTNALEWTGYVLAFLFLTISFAVALRKMKWFGFLRENSDSRK